MKEADLRLLIQVALTQEGARIFRNNSGLFYTKDGRPTHAGLCKGSSDLIGWTSKGIFLAIEVKTKRGSIRLEQAQFLLQVNNFGGIGMVVYSVEEAVKKYREMTSNEKL